MRYFKCELHTHTTASDGKMSPERLVKRAIECGYDLIAVTDHNTVSNADEVFRLGQQKGLCVIKGIEWTTFWGHITVLGGNSDVDWRDITPQNLDTCIKKAQSKGDFVSIAHPRRMGFPLCAGCHCDFDTDSITNADGYEIWSHYYPNEGVSERQQREQWYSFLKEGRRLTALYGYDWHSEDIVPPPHACTYVGAKQCTPDEILKSLKEANVYIAMGVKIHCRAYCEGKQLYFGQSVARGKTLNIECKVEIDKNYRAGVVKEIKSIVLNTTKGRYEYPCEEMQEITAEWTAEGFANIEVFGNIEGKTQRLAITNPFFEEAQK